MVRFFGHWGLKVCKMFFLPRPRKAKIDFLKKKREKSLKERDPPWRKQGHTDSFLHLRAAHLDNKPVDPAT